MMAVNKVNFQRMVSQQPQMIVRLTQLLAERIWFSYKQLENTQISNPLGRLFDALYIQLEKSRVNIAPKSGFTFSMGPKELIDMVGFSKEDSQSLLKELFANSKITIQDDKIRTSDTEEVSKQANYFRKMEKIEQSRRKSSIMSGF